MSKRLFTSESVTEGHPDKVCDKISDAVLDSILREDAKARVACETCCTTDLVMVMGEITTNATVNIEKVVRDTVRDIGYTSDDMGFSADTCKIIVALDSQSPDIALGVDKSLETKEGKDDQEAGAGDQGMMFGYACSETPDYMPTAIYLAHKLAKKLTAVRKDGTLNYLRPDGKTQVTVAYDDKGKVSVDTVVISTQHEERADLQTIRKDMIEFVIKPILGSLYNDSIKIFVNPTGKFVVGGPHGDSGLTGRKIIVDTYGGSARHGGGAFSGKDPSKVDRSATYYARYVAKNIVAAGLATECEIQVAYAIGVAKPVSVRVNTYGTGVVSDSKIESFILKVFDFRPTHIIANLGLQRPLYFDTAAYGHFGIEGYPWERLDKVNELKALIN